jgi:hypothetical protein
MSTSTQLELRANIAAISAARAKLYPKGSFLYNAHKLEAAMADGPPVETKLRHDFFPGLYIRTIFIPADTVITGKTHRFEHLTQLLQGTATITTEHDGVNCYTGPINFRSKDGVKRVIHTHTDCIFSTFHATTETDISKLEDMLTYPHTMPDEEVQP